MASCIVKEAQSASQVALSNEAADSLPLADGVGNLIQVEDVEFVSTSRLRRFWSMNPGGGLSG